MAGSYSSCCCCLSYNKLKLNMHFSLYVCKADSKIENLYQVDDGPGPLDSRY